MGWNGIVKALEGRKTNIGLILAGALGLFVAWTEYTWADVEWLAYIIAVWTGISISQKVNRGIKAMRDK